ncbi:hypothetical protein JCGZ_05440 [Jatropha curcas]|uniref:Coiled-coil SMC6 And NSE5 INteracting (CANIN) domain-containing protein n=1 Tax=Jatropha curcas TaxID=180498 RepID=A0A067L9Q1_JATCU|nr:uncharacterized protein LOC105628018 isoform X1 [Jatropha curcas]KDP43973.1 hypothetical protein JCGZ_05440 [Jatropha curcas]
MEINMDEPLDFESEDTLLSAPVINQKRMKVIGLDDLLTDYYKEKSKVVEREAKRAKASKKNYNSDEDDRCKEALLSRKINECHNQMRDMGGEEEISIWGVQVFGNQKTPPPISFPELGSCSFLQSFTSNKLNTLVELNPENGETFLEGLLVNGWLSKLISRHGHVEKSIAKWTFYLMLYSSKEKLRTSACDFWCIILSSEKKAEKLPIRIEWFPSYSDFKRALETYGFLFDFSSPAKANTDSIDRGLPINIRRWLKFTSVCCLVRSKVPIFSPSEAEELVQYAICLSLDRQLQGLLMLLCECMQSAISYFTDEEWSASCEKIAREVACRVPRDLNCLRAVECISGVGTRNNDLRSAVSYQILLVCFNNKATNEEEILKLLMSINVKDKNCDFFKIYIYLVLTENWLLSNPILEYKPVIYEMWGLYLRNCSCLISSTNSKPYASKVRTKASYLLHSSANKVVL